MKRALAAWAMAFLVACVHAEERPACSPAALAELKAEYFREILDLCMFQTFDECAAIPAIRARYAHRWEAWERCR